MAISCGKIEPKGEIINKDIPLQPFSEMNLKGKYRLFFVPNEENFINVETHQNIEENLSIDNKNGILSIAEKRETNKVDFYNITIYAKNLPKKITLSDSLEFNVVGRMKNNNLTLVMDKDARFIGALDYDKLSLEMKNTARANFLGKAKTIKLIARDSANIIAPYFKVNTLEIKAKNGGYTEIYVKDTIKGELSDAFKLMYYGSPIYNVKSIK